MAPDIRAFYADLGRRIQQRRKARGLSQERVGQMLRPAVQRASIANVEGGNQGVLVHTLVQIAQILAISPQELLPSPLMNATPRLRERVEAELATKLDVSPSQSRQLAQSLLLAELPGKNASPPKKQNRKRSR